MCAMPDDAQPLRSRPRRADRERFELDMADSQSRRGANADGRLSVHSGS